MKRVPLVRKTPLRSKGIVRRAPHSKKPKRSSGFTEETKARVRRRSGNQCEVRGEGCTHKAYEFHHRKLRRFGDHTPENCLHACLACHHYIHANPELSYVMGWLVPSYKEPIKVPVLRGAG